MTLRGPGEPLASARSMTSGKSNTLSAGLSSVGVSSNIRSPLPVGCFRPSCRAGRRSYVPESAICAVPVASPAGVTNRPHGGRQARFRPAGSARLEARLAAVRARCSSIELSASFSSPARGARRFVSTICSAEPDAAVARTSATAASARMIGLPFISASAASSAISAAASTMESAGLDASTSAEERPPSSTSRVSRKKSSRAESETTSSSAREVSRARRADARPATAFPSGHAGEPRPTMTTSDEAIAAVSAAADPPAGVGAGAASNPSTSSSASAPRG